MRDPHFAESRSEGRRRGGASDGTDPAATPAYERPAFEVIALGCEITAYAPDGDDPLF